ncbi:MAG: TlpA family protein disulfide reductase [Candidatus Eisenbacteria bacterium]|nr:TlpA family protein disulfide reductase [Candidatus Eisenbacteria bacterium]
MRRTSFAPPMLRWLVSIIVVAAGLASTAAPARAADPKPRPAPSFSLPSRHGTASLDSLRGRVVLVDFWASWCQPCRKSFPWMKAMSERYGPRGFTVVAINLDKEPAAATAFLDRFEAPFEIAFDPAGEAADAYKVSVMPTSFLIDRSGVIVSTHAGFDPRKAAAAESLIAGACAR